MGFGRHRLDGPRTHNLRYLASSIPNVCCEFVEIINALAEFRSLLDVGA